MEEKIEILMSLSAATAVHCVPCFEHYYKKAVEVGLNEKEIRMATDIAKKVKNGAELAIRRNISEIMRDDHETSSCCGEQSNTSCCG